jgi:hypothetical protein
MQVKCVVAATNANGEPDLYFLKVSCTNRQYSAGEHYARAKQAAEDEGYEEPMVAFDQCDAAGKAMLPLFQWETASLVRVGDDEL